MFEPDGTRLIIVDESLHWRAALAGDRPQVLIGEPQCGCYKRKLVKDGPWVSARIFLAFWVDERGELVSDETLRCEVGGKDADPMVEWMHVADHPISREDYDFLSRTHAWAQETGARHPNASPGRPVDWLNVDIRL